MSHARLFICNTKYIADIGVAFCGGPIGVALCGGPIGVAFCGGPIGLAFYMRVGGCPWGVRKTLPL